MFEEFESRSDKSLEVGCLAWETPNLPITGYVWQIRQTVYMVRSWESVEFVEFVETAMLPLYILMYFVSIFWNLSKLPNAYKKY